MAAGVSKRGRHGQQISKSNICAINSGNFFPSPSIVDMKKPAIGGFFQVRKTAVCMFT